jgi:hypothetical protein
MNIDEFIAHLKDSIRPFEYADPIATRYFMLSYDQSVSYFKDDPRKYIIAALHARGAHDMKSYVASTIIFKAPATVGRAQIAINNWRNFLIQIFEGEDNFRLMICVVKQYANTLNPIFLNVPDKQIEFDFHNFREEVIEKFEDN